MNWRRLLTCSVCVTAFGICTGCEPRPVDVEQQSESEPREREGMAPPTGLEANPGAPQREGVPPRDN
ncbi:hypothetical protein Mal4_22780 [Maioricimonas rarisocia]|uniref:Uncharacterized protein n=1 Tax=Maioricimonas rarisocia TaxID=2528026 RepID=A0A517Z6A2_9PLAN|nr:hypothetical protein [Maioricimonas rarisocia]QDU37959.1 hypothetical protein Mal4_22780 [Maioricimonas rarisocia]